MMKLLRVLPPLILAVLMLSVQGCAAAAALFPPTATPTATATATFPPTPSAMATPAATATLTPTPQPDFVAAALQVSDLPSGFIAITPPAKSDQATQWFEYADRAEDVLGFASRFGAEDQKQNFDLILGNPRFLSNFLGLELSGAKIASATPYPGLDMYGDKSTAYVATVLGYIGTGGDRVHADIFMVRKGSVGVLAVAWYIQGDTPEISLPDLAAAVNKRLLIAAP
jgi:hypothetical protein